MQVGAGESPGSGSATSAPAGNLSPNSSAAEPQHGSYRWYVLFVLTLAQTCHFIDRSVVALVLEPMRAEFGFSDSQLGAIAGLAYGIAFSIVAIPFGLLVDRYNRAKLLAVAITLWSAFTALCGLAQGYVSLLLCRGAVGAAEAGGSPTGMSLISDYFEPKERATAISIWYVSGALGTVITFLAGAAITQAYGWRVTFFFAGLPGIFIGLLVLLTVREVRQNRGPHDGMPGPTTISLRAKFGYISKQPAMLHCMAGIVLLAMATSAKAAWLASFLIRSHGFSLSEAGIIASVAFGVFGGAGAFLAGASVDWLNRRRGFSLRRSAYFAASTAAIAGITGIVTVLAESAMLMLVFMMIFSLVQPAHNGVINSMLLTLADAGLRGFTVALVQVLANLLGWGFGPYIVGLVSSSVGGSNSLGIGLAIAFLLNLWGALHFLLAGRAASRPLRHAELASV